MINNNETKKKFKYETVNFYSTEIETIKLPPFMKSDIILNYNKESNIQELTISTIYETMNEINYYSDVNIQEYKNIRYKHTNFTVIIYHYINIKICFLEKLINLKKLNDRNNQLFSDIQTIDKDLCLRNKQTYIEIVDKINNYISVINISIKQTIELINDSDSEIKELFIGTIDYYFKNLKIIENQIFDINQIVNLLQNYLKKRIFDKELIQETNQDISKTEISSNIAIDDNKELIQHIVEKLKEHFETNSDYIKFNNLMLNNEKVDSFILFKKQKSKQYFIFMIHILVKNEIIKQSKMNLILKQVKFWNNSSNNFGIDNIPDNYKHSISKAKNKYLESINESESIQSFKDDVIFQIIKTNNLTIPKNSN